VMVRQARPAPHGECAAPEAEMLLVLLAQTFTPKSCAMPRRPEA
jgi:hypothetical protein